MSRVIHSQVFAIGPIAKSGNQQRIARALSVVQEKADIFTKMVPWPALAASFQRDADILSAALLSNEEHCEPQDRQSPARC